MPPTLDISGILPDELRSLIKGEPGIETENEDIDILTERFRDRLGLIKVPAPARFYTLHPAVAYLLARDDARGKGEVSTFAYRESLFDAPFERRRLHLLNRLFLGLKRVGCSVEAEGEGVRSLCAYICTIPVRFTLDAIDARSDDFTRSRYRSRPAAALAALRICAPKSPERPTYWVESEDARLDNHLTEAVVAMAIVAEERRRSSREHRATLERERNERLAAETLQRTLEMARLERERLEAAERDRVAALRSYAERWKAASVIRDFIKAANASLANRLSAAALAEWSRWAESVACEIDPLGHDLDHDSLDELITATMCPDEGAPSL
jgi:hypothetical protein